jgi:palmitoyl-protein thioesterase
MVVTMNGLFFVHVLCLALFWNAHGADLDPYEEETPELDTDLEEGVHVPNGAPPIVLWHGMGDTCCFPFSIGGFKTFLEKEIQGVHVVSLMIGKNIEEDFEHGYLMDCNKQIDFACNVIKSDPQLKGGYNAIGFSQGGQFLRALVQRCPDPPALNLVTFGAQHQGVYGLPRCPGENATLCNLVRKLLNYGAYTDFVQKHVVQAQYWHDPIQEDEYRKKSLFLADINNENEPRNQDYANRIKRLQNLVMIMFADDHMVDPKESELFGFYSPGQGREVDLLNETALYREDWLGLKALDLKGGLRSYTVPGDHLQIDMDWFLSEIVNKYLR